MKKKVLFWDNHGTITRIESPTDITGQPETVLPGVKKTMESASCNVIVSGCKTEEVNLYQTDVHTEIARYMDLMELLPIDVIAFAPFQAGDLCYVLIKKSDGTLTIKKAHEDERYKEHVGDFKKPGIGMFAVLKDVLAEEFGHDFTDKTAAMIGDQLQDQEAAKAFGIPFVPAFQVHETDPKS